MRISFALSLFLGLAKFAVGQEIAYQVPADPNDVTLAAVIPDLAGRLIAASETSDHDRYLLNQFWLQLTARHFAAALAAASEWHKLRGPANTDADVASLLPLEIYAQAKSTTTERKDFDAAYSEAFSAAFGSLDDKTAYAVLLGRFRPPPIESLRRHLREILDKQRGKDRIAISDGLTLCMTYALIESSRASAPLTEALTAEDSAKRYIIDDVLISTPDGAMINAVVARPKSASAPLPALLEFTVYTYMPPHAQESAAHGYAGVVGFSRGKRHSPDSPVLFERDGDDARAVINWISHQPWSDGRVGMYGGSYNGFTQWAAAKHPPPALKAIMPSVTVGPGIDVPMQSSNIFVNFFYPFVPYATNNKLLDDATYNDRARWDKLNRTWYLTGQPYRSLDRIDGTPSPIYRRWLDHPSYDSYWQHMIPYREEFAKIDIPVLQTYGYYGDAGQAAIYYYPAPPVQPTGEPHLVGRSVRSPWRAALVHRCAARLHD